ncbi:hypothetical protein ETB97_004275 [Aspergillus alliaceus]|uniref:Uncharacterized protein n=1 Tax=Petromyces alliaceus TaxID=209559 RepID=A0A5N7CIC1_PETAA|nr:uncharacterized protein BDW43DRAFT_313300 [Aspergillus alliaceus]KAB8231221.1 hypothetical protein BDW43DRAFT_313300 [Aspergillus alliaceus]KAE8393805.1 hypothetical protein BDV23DRAFT_180255 [Aspergillus alliaceus]KAF5858532.1 hypothetical protein ETB97_004275 [Aspergillus burnettii]
MQFKSIVLSIFVATASAGYVQLCGPQGCTDTGDANDNTCIGPVQGKGKFTFQAHGATPGTMSIFTDKGCWDHNVATCDDCQTVTWNGQGPVWAIFH